VAQKARKEAKTKVREEAKRKRVAEEKKKKKGTLEYLQQLRDKVLEEETAFLEDTKEYKYKEVTTRDKKKQWPSRRLNGSNKGSTMGVLQSR